MRKHIGIIVIIILAALVPVWADHDEDNWIQPNKWTLEDKEFAAQYPKREPFDKCSMGGGGGVPSDDAVALVYYKKFIGHLFSRKKLKYDETAELFKRTVVFTLLPAQLEKLEHLSDPRDLDSVLTEIFTNARTIVQQSDGGRGDYKIVADETSFLSLIWDIVKDIWQLLKISEVQFLLWVASAVLAGWFINRRYRIGITKLIVGCFLLFGYFYTYFECNRKLEVEQMLEVLENEQGQPAVSWFMRLFGSSSTSDNRNNKIKKTAQINMPFCRPDHVFIIYINELLLKQLELFLDKCTNTFMSLRDNLSFPFNYFAGFMLVFLIAYILKLTFKYILNPGAWVPLLRRSTSNTSSASHQHTSHAQVLHSNTGFTAITEDKVSGENLKLLLNVLNVNMPLSQPQSPVSAIEGSGVQELNAMNDSNCSSKSTASSNSNDINNVKFKPNETTEKLIESNVTAILQEQQLHESQNEPTDSKA